MQRGSSSAAGIAGGLAGALLVAALGSFQCAKCGKIAQGEFPPEVRNKITIHSIGMVVGAIALIIGVIALIVIIKT